jgi:hypothetical protein
MEFDAHILNIAGDKRSAEMMEQDGLIHNATIKMTAERLYKLSMRYDVTIRTTGVLTRVFLAHQATYLPGDYSE